MPKPSIVNKIWTTNEANTPARTADQVQPKKPLGTVRGAMIDSPPVRMPRFSNATLKRLFLSGTADGASPFTLWRDLPEELTMTFGRGALLWLLGIPLPVLLLLALFWR